LRGDTLAADAGGPLIYVPGEVPKPGPLPARDAPNLALAAAGVTASHDSVAVIRLEEDGLLTVTSFRGKMPFYMAMSERDPKSKFPVQTLNIPKNSANITIGSDRKTRRPHRWTGLR